MGERSAFTSGFLTATEVSAGAPSNKRMELTSASRFAPQAGPAGPRGSRVLALRRALALAAQARCWTDA